MKTTIALAALLSLSVGAAQAATMTFTPTADGDVQTFGGDDVDTTDTTLSFVQSGGLARNAILEFDLSAIADDATINSATISFTLTSFVTNTGTESNVDVFAYNGDGTVDIDDFDATATQVVDETITTSFFETITLPSGGTFPSRVLTTAAGDVLSFMFDTVAPVSSALAGDLLTLRVETDNFASFQFAALENGTFDAAQLSIDYTPAVTTPPVPLPAGLPMLLAGLGAFAWVRRKA